MRIVELAAVTKIYAGNVAALRGVDLVIEAGELTAIVGPSGSGKSTLLHLIGTLDRPSEGTIRIAGHDVAALSDRELSALRARSALERVGLAHRIGHRPNQLSGGEQQRVGVARAVVGEPDLLLADEPTGNLGSTAGAEVLGALRDLHGRGTTIAIITHDLEIAQWAPRQVRVRDGRIVADGGPGNGRYLTASLKGGAHE